MKKFSKKIITLLLVVIMLSNVSTFALAKVKTHDITMSELQELEKKYNIKTTVVDSSENIPSELILKNITKEELERLIVEGQSNNSEQVKVEKIEIDSNTLINDPEAQIIDSNTTSNTFDSSAVTSTNENEIASISALPTITTVYKSKTFVRADASISPNLQLKRTIDIYWKYEYYFDNTDKMTHYQNLKITNACNSTITHLNPEPYTVFYTLTDELYSYDYAEEFYVVRYNIATYAYISGQIIKIPLGENYMNGTDSYYLSDLSY